MSPRNETVAIRLTREELAEFKAVAAAVDMNVAVAVRALIRSKALELGIVK